MEEVLCRYDLPRVLQHDLDEAVNNESKRILIYNDPLISMAHHADEGGCLSMARHADEGGCLSMAHHADEGGCLSMARHADEGGCLSMAHHAGWGILQQHVLYLVLASTNMFTRGPGWQTGWESCEGCGMPT